MNRIRDIANMPAYCGLAASLYLDIANTLWRVTGVGTHNNAEDAIAAMVAQKIAKEFHIRAEELKRIADATSNP